MELWSLFVGVYHLFCAELFLLFVSPEDQILFKLTFYSFTTVFTILISHPFFQTVLWYTVIWSMLCVYLYIHVCMYMCGGGGGGGGGGCICAYACVCVCFCASCKKHWAIFMNSVMYYVYKNIQRI